MLIPAAKPVLSMTLYCGTSGFSYTAWVGSFYPRGTRAGDMLTQYAQRLPSVEINNTFYRMPKPNVLATWHDRVPERFRFAVKAPRRISHVKRLVDCDQEIDYLVEALAALGDKLGTVLVQLPPFLREDMDVLARFLERMPRKLPLAFEFRHASWHNERVLTLLVRHGAVLVVADQSGEAPAELPVHGSWCYLRLRAPAYSERSLAGWAAYCARFERSFVFFKHEDEAVGPRLAERLLELSKSPLSPDRDHGA